MLKLVFWQSKTLHFKISNKIFFSSMTLLNTSAVQFGIFCHYLFNNLSVFHINYTVWFSTGKYWRHNDIGSGITNKFHINDYHIISVIFSENHKILVFTRRNEKCFLFKMKIVWNLCHNLIIIYWFRINFEIWNILNLDSAWFFF